MLRKFVLVGAIDDVVFMLRPSFCHRFTGVANIYLFALFAVDCVNDSRRFTGPSWLDLHLGSVVLVHNRFFLIQLLA